MATPCSLVMKSVGPEYKKRFGFYYLCISIAYSFSYLVKAAFEANEMSVIDALKVIRLDYSFVLEDMGNAFVAALSNHEKLSFGPTKLLIVISAILGIAFYSYLLWEPKLTMEKGHFWKIFGGFLVFFCLSNMSVALFLCSNSSIFSGFFEKLGVVIQNSSQLNFNPKFLTSVQNFQSICSAFFKYQALIYVIYALFAVMAAFIYAAVYTLDEEYDGFGSCLICMKPYRMAESLPISFNNVEPVKYVQPIPLADSQKAIEKVKQ